MSRMRHVDNTHSNRLSHEYKFGFYFDNRHVIKHSQNFITRKGAVLSLILTLFKLNRRAVATWRTYSCDIASCRTRY